MVITLSELLTAISFYRFYIPYRNSTERRNRQKILERRPESVNILKPVGNRDDHRNYNIHVLGEALKILPTDIVLLKQWDCEKVLTESMKSIEALF